MRSFQKRLDEFTARGLHLVAITADAPEVNRRHCEQSGFTFPVLTDPKTEVIARYNLLHQGGGPNGADIARPAEFLIDSTGTVRWMNLTDSVTVRARPGQVLKAFDDLKLPAPTGRE